MSERKYGAARPLPRCIQPTRGGLWECVWFLRRAPIGRSKLWWAHAVKLRSQAAVEALESWWIQNHWAISDWERRRRRREGQGNVLLVRCEDRALVLTNARKAAADALEFEIRRHAFAPAGLRPRMKMHHFRDGFLFHDVFIRYYSPDGSKKRVYVVPSERSREELVDAVHRVCHRDLRRFQRKPIAIIRAYNETVKTWWESMRYCDWTPEEIKRLDEDVFKILLPRTAGSLRLRNLDQLRRDAGRPSEKRLSPEKRLPVEIRDRYRWHRWVRNRTYRMQGRRIWRLGPDSLSRDQSERGSRRDAVREAAVTVPPRGERVFGQALVVGHRFRQRNTKMLQALVVQFQARKLAIGIGLTKEDRTSPPAVGETITFQYRLKYGVPRYPSFVRGAAPGTQSISK